MATEVSSHVGVRLAVPSWFGRARCKHKGTASRTPTCVALDIGYLEPDEFHELYRIAEETASLIGGFTSYLRVGLRLRTPD